MGTLDQEQKHKDEVEDEKQNKEQVKKEKLGDKLQRGKKTRSRSNSRCSNLSSISLISISSQFSESFDFADSLVPNHPGMAARGAFRGRGMMRGGMAGRGRGRGEDIKLERGIVPEGHGFGRNVGFYSGDDSSRSRSSRSSYSRSSSRSSYSSRSRSSRRRRRRKRSSRSSRSYSSSSYSSRSYSSRSSRSRSSSRSKSKSKNQQQTATAGWNSEDEKRRIDQLTLAGLYNNLPTPQQQQTPQQPIEEVVLPQVEMDVVERVFTMVETTAMLFDDKDKEKGPTLKGHDHKLVKCYVSMQEKSLQNSQQMKKKTSRS